MLTVSLLFAALASSSSAKGNPRIVRTLADGWKFEQRDEAGAETTAYNDRAWQSIRVPHSYGADPTNPHGKFYRGPAWYRHSLSIGSDVRSKELYLRFGAACLTSQVFVNGQKVGEHLGGFAAFCYDITKYVHPGSNEIAVRTDNSYREDVTPLSGDFNVNGGLYRDVDFIALNPVSISPMDDASSGVYATPAVESGTGTVSIRTVVQNNLPISSHAIVEASLLDAKGTLVSKISISQLLEANSTQEIEPKIKIASPHLWNGVNDPYLYKVRVDVLENRKLLDRVEQPFGFRTFTVDPEKGLLLNGTHYDYHGVNVHQGRPSVGWASTAEMVKEDYSMIKEVGATGVRMCHYQHADREYDECDKDGLVVWSELALVNKMTDTPAFRDNAEQQLREMVKQEYNHPSILFWSLYNEAWIDKKKGPDEWKLLQELSAICHSLDPIRKTTVASSWSANADFDWYTDITSFNRYWGWYSGKKDFWPEGITALRKEADGRTFGISEYGAGGSTTQHEIAPQQPIAGGKWHPEEYESLAHEAIWPYLANQDWMWCKLLWVMYDFPVSSRNEGDHPGMNDKGLVTGDRKTKKDVFYYYKSQWSKDPFVYITSRRFNPRPAGPSEIKVYSNCKTVELFVDGKSLGTKSSTTGVFVWPEVNFSEENVNAVATAVGKSSKVKDTVNWLVQRRHPLLKGN